MGNAAGGGGVGNNANRRKSMERRPSLSISNIGEGVKVSNDDIQINTNNNKNNDKRYAEGNKDRSRSPNAKDALGKERMVEGKNNNGISNVGKNGKLNRANTQG